MIKKDMVIAAKQFLCWDTFPDLTIQLIEVVEPVSYFFAPKPDSAAILLFMKSENGDYSKSLFLLFHEVGHYLQLCDFQKNDQITQYWDLVEKASGTKKIQFEESAWLKGRKHFIQFINAQSPSLKNSISTFDEYAQISINTYI